MSEQYNDHDDRSLGSKAKKGVIWYVLKTLGGQGSRFVTSIVLARILFPEDFGMMGMVLIVTRLAKRLGNFGFTQVLVQRKTIDDSVVRTTFTLNFLVFFAITAAIFFSAPFLANIVTNEADIRLLPQITDILRVIAFEFLLLSFYNVPNSLLKREMKFREESLIGMSADMVRYLSPIPMALAGLGVWSMVFGSLLGHTASVAGFYITTRWKPKFGLQRDIVREIFSFGAWMNIYSYVNYMINNIDYFMISKFLGAAQLGFYERAFNLMNAPRKRIGNMISTVLFSTYSRMQDQNERLLRAFDKVMRSVALISFPVMTWLYFVAPSLIPLLYGEKWLPTVLPTQIMCISGLIQSFAMIFNPALIAKGLVRQRTQAYFLSLLVLAGGVYYGARYSINGVAIAVAGASFFTLFFNGYMFRRDTGWPWINLWKNIKPSFLLALFAGGIMFSVRALIKIPFEDNDFIIATAVSLAALIGFLGGAYLFRFKEMIEIFHEVFGDILDKLKKFKRKGLQES